MTELEQILCRNLTDLDIKKDVFVEYDVHAADKIERRSCHVSDVPKLESIYELLVMNDKVPVVSRVVNPDYFYLLSFERTHFSRTEFFEVVTTGTFFEVESMMNYFFWDSSTQSLTTSGSPTIADVEYWMQLVKDRKDLPESQVEELIGQCEQYIKG